MIEEWRPVVGHEHAYEVSSLGNVRSLSRSYSRSKEVNGHVVTCVVNMTGRLLQPGASRSGHVSVAIGKGNSRLVHQLVAEAFIGPKPDDHEVLHINHVPNDNRACNLKYGTRSENLKMDYAAGNKTVPIEWIYSTNGVRNKHWSEYDV